MQRLGNSLETSLQNTELVQLITENIKEYAIFTTDADGRVDSWNTGAERLLGYGETEIIGQPVSAIFFAEDQTTNALIAEMEKAAREGRAESNRWLRHKDGSRIWASRTVMPLKSAGETLCGFVEIIRDETEKKLTGGKLDESNQRIEHILSGVSDSFFTLDRNFRYVYINRATTKMFDLSESEFLGKTIFELFPDVEGSIFHSEVQRAFDEQKPAVFDNYYSPLDRWFENRVYPSPDGTSIFVTEITERKRVEKTLSDSEERYRTLFNSIDEGFCIIEMIYDDAGKPVNWLFVEANPAFEKNNSIKDVTGKTILELAPGIEPKWFEIYDRVAKTGKPERFIERSEVLNIWFDVYAFRIGKPEDGKLAVLFNDVSIRKQSEESLRESEESYRTLFNSIDEGFCVIEMLFDENGKAVDYLFLETNTRFEEQAGFKDAKGRRMREIIPEHDEHWFEIYGNIALTGEPLRFENEAAQLNRWFELYAFRFGKAEQRQVGVLFKDITERKLIEQEREKSRRFLEAERARLAYIFENAPAFVAVLRGAEHIYEITNPAYLQLIGHRNVIGKTIREALPDIAGQGYYELLDKVYQTGEAYIGRESAVEIQRAPHSLHEKKIVDFVFQPIFEADSSVSGIFVHGVDITDQVEARHAAETANHLKDEFLATLSHELRTPLNSILGWSQMLQARSFGETETKKALSTIERNARAQNQLIDDILDVSRIITGKFRLDVRAVDLPNVISAAVDAARPAAEAKDIRLQILLDPQAGPISGDPDRLQQVVWNLLSNAVKFTPKGGRIQVRLERINSHVEIVISDTGKGIEPVFLPHVFDRFRQSDGSMTRRHGGLGLGLAIVRQIVELHGGTVVADSAGENQGAAFTISLPLLPIRQEPISDVPRAHPQAIVSNSEDCLPEIDGLRLLIVDDEPDSRDLLNTVLVSCGATVTQADSAVGAFDLIEREKFDVIISDIGMPEEDGFSLIGKIRALPDEQGGNIPAVALTAYARSEDRIKAIRSGFQMHISKPVEPSELITVIANLAGRIRNPK